MSHRHLDYPEGAPVDRLGLAALDDLLERGDLRAWQPLARAVAADPHGPLADKVSHLVDAHQMYGTSALWRAWIDGLRGEDTQTLTPGVRLSDLRRRAGLTQRELAARMGVTQPDLSRLERRRDAKLSTLRSYVAATGSRLRLVVTRDGREVELNLGAAGGHDHPDAG